MSLTALAIKNARPKGKAYKLSDAREKLAVARKQIAEGLDPMAEKKLKKIRAQIDSNITFKSIAEEWVLKCEREGRAEITLENVRWLLDKAYPVLGARF